MIGEGMSRGRDGIGEAETGVLGLEDRKSWAQANTDTLKKLKRAESPIRSSRRKKLSDNLISAQ